MDTYWIPGVNNVRTYGKWAFAEFTDVWTLADDLENRIKEELDQTIERLIPVPAR
jgi:type III restriction enzyme